MNKEATVENEGYWSAMKRLGQLHAKSFGWSILK